MKIPKERAFTLVEVLVYLGFTAVFLAGAVVFLGGMTLANEKTEALREVRENGKFAMRKILFHIEKAKQVITPANGASTSTLVLEMANPSLNPTVFQVVGGTLQMSQGGSLPLPLTSNAVEVSSIQFRNAGAIGAPASIKVEMIISYRNPLGLSEYAAVLDFFGSGSLRFLP